MKKKKLNGIKANVKRRKTHLKTLTIHANHYKMDKEIYAPIIKQLLKEGWKIDKSRSKPEKIGTHIFQNVWLDRAFYK